MMIDYQKLLGDSVMMLIRNILLSAASETNLAISINFKTQYPGVVLSERIRKMYPSNIIITLQHQYRELRIYQDRFSVIVSFNGIEERIEIPLAAISSLHDISQKIGFSFTNMLTLDMDSDSGESEYSIMECKLSDADFDIVSELGIEDKVEKKEDSSEALDNIHFRRFSSIKYTDE